MIGVVKTTWLRWLVDLGCPHYCLTCGALGRALCGRCKKYIVENAEEVCLECGEATVAGVCDRCKLPFESAYMVGYRDEPLGAVAEQYKFESVWALGWELAEVLHRRLPCWSRVVVVPVPTVRRHVRQRGLDHTQVVARELAGRRGWRLDGELVVRGRETVQTGVDRRARQNQAREAFRLAGRPRADADYLVVDDVWTTGASVKAVCELLKNAGAQRVSVAVLVRSR